MKFEAFNKILSKSHIERVIYLGLYDVYEVHFCCLKKVKETSPDSYRGYPLNYGANWVCEFMNSFKIFGTFVTKGFHYENQKETHSVRRGPNFP